MRTLRSGMFKSLALAAGTLLAGNASAATLADLGLSPEQIRAITAMANAPATAPGLAFGSPTGFGAGWGIIGIGVSGQTVSNGSNDVDGSMSVSFGLGNPGRWVGLQADINVISLTDAFGEDGNIGLKLHTALPGRSAFAVGVENLAPWGFAKGRDESVYAAYTKVFQLNPDNPVNPVPLSVNIGVGDGRFESNNNEGVGLFGSLAIVPWQQVSFIVDWAGQGLNIATSFVPFRRIPLNVTLGAINVTERAPGPADGSAEFSASVGYAIRF